MKISEFKKLIREEIRRVLSEDASVNAATLKNQFSKIDWDLNGDDIRVSDIKPGMAIRFSSKDPKFKKDSWMEGIVVAVDNKQIKLALAKDKGKTVVTILLKYISMLSNVSSRFVSTNKRSSGSGFQHPMDTDGSGFQHPMDTDM